MLSRFRPPGSRSTPSRSNSGSSIHPRHGDSCTLTAGPAEQPGDPNEEPCAAADIDRFSVHVDHRRVGAFRDLGVYVPDAAACAALCVADGDDCKAFETSSFTPNPDKDGNARAAVTQCKRVEENLPLVNGAVDTSAATDFMAVTSRYRTFTLYDQNDNACSN